MARSTKPRRSRSSRKPVTIDLEAQAVDDVVTTENTDANSTNDQAAEPVAFEDLSAKTAEAADAAADKAKEDLEDVTPEPEPNTAQSTSATPVQGGNRGSALTGGLIGGLLALLGAAGLQWSGLLPSFGNQAAPAAQVDLTPLQNEIAALKTQLASVKDTNSVQVAGVPANVTTSIQEAKAASQEALTGVAGIQETVTALDAKIGDLQSTVSSGGAGENAGLEVLSKRLDGLDVELGAVSKKLAAAPAGTSGDVDEVIAPTVKRVKQLDSIVEALATKLVSVERTASTKIAALETQIKSMDAKVAEGGGGADVAAAIAAAGLKSAIDRGGSFMSELEAYATVSFDTEVIDELRNYAASGVPTINQLSDGFPAVANSIVATGQGLDADASVADRLMASARSLVQVRPKGEVEGETPGAIAARVETRLNDGDLSAAIEQYEALPEAAKEKTADFAAQMRARQTVDALVAKALTGAMAATAPKAN